MGPLGHESLLTLARKVHAAAAVRVFALEAGRGWSRRHHRCSARPEELAALLVLQARDERLALHHFAA